MSEERRIEQVLIPQLFKEGHLGDLRPSEYSILRVSAKPVEVNGFMLSAPVRVEIEFSRRGNKAGTERRFLVVKQSPAGIARETYEAAQFDALFANEHVAYTEIIPLLSGAKKYPRLYYTERKELSAMCVMDDFSRYGWRSSRHLYNLPLENILLAVKEIGGFHGEMYGLKHESSERFEGVVSKLREARWANDEIIPFYNAELITGIKRAVAVTRNKRPGVVSEQFLEQLLAYTAHPLTFLRHCLKPREPLATICHGDYLRNNVAYKFGVEQQQEGEEVPIDVMMYDFQTMRYSSPMIDITILLLVSASHELRSKHFNEIFKLYFDTMIESYCSRRGLGRDQVPDFMSLESLLKEYYKLFAYGLIISGSFLRLLVEPREEVWSDLSAVTVEGNAADTMTRGGKVVDDELSAQVLEFFRLSEKFGESFEIRA